MKRILKWTICALLLDDRSYFSDKTYKFSEVPSALAYLETGHARGKVVIIVQ
jgi:NADPH:quinone reductase-like Zn-dependent oxidoreductase